MENAEPLKTASLEALLAHADWVRSLSRALVRDVDTANDIEQEVWREAVERPPANLAHPRGWLTRVAQNAARMQMRSRNRSRAREIDSARNEAVPSTLDIVAEAEMSRSLAEIV